MKTIAVKINRDAGLCIENIQAALGNTYSVRELPETSTFNKKEIASCLYDVLEEYEGCDKNTICGFTIGRLNAMEESRKNDEN